MAFDRWEEISNLKFENVQNPYRKKPDITITVIRKNHNFRADCQGTSKCPHNFDGPGKVLAHAYFPNENSKCVEIHLDAEEKWYLGNSTSPDGQTNLLMVLIHEIGHALGLGHSGVNTSIMYPWYQASPASFDIDDKRAIEYLYGQKTENNRRTSTAPTTKSQKAKSWHVDSPTTVLAVLPTKPQSVDIPSITSKPPLITTTKLCEIQVPDFMFLATAPQFSNYRMYVGCNRFLWKIDLIDMCLKEQRRSTEPTDILKPGTGPWLYILLAAGSTLIVAAAIGAIILAVRRFRVDSPVRNSRSRSPKMEESPHTPHVQPLYTDTISDDNNPDLIPDAPNNEALLNATIAPYTIMARPSSKRNCATQMPVKPYHVTWAPMLQSRNCSTQTPPPHKESSV
ncbi:unnamed protein product [Phaedon cochleariae]|uniref:Peptidase metallopeptidase domain-containing protein n=1 Tax=Phaedon cochleariae TaxID=80249 RepID=A0A9N9SC31_PHACE|nr:unnamed protein product [Phaedon cochleariae]